MDVASYLLGKSQGGGGGGSAVTSVNGQTGDVVLSIPSKTSDLINDSDYKKILDIAITTTIDDGETEQLNSEDVATLTAMAEEWYESIDKTQSRIVIGELAKVVYGVDGDMTMTGIVNYVYDNDGENAGLGIDVNFGNFGDMYHCDIYFVIENDEPVYEADGCTYTYFVGYDEFQDVVGNINAVLETLVTVEEGEE